MLSFKKYLVEYLTDKQRQRYSGIEMTPKARADTDHFFGVGNDTVHDSLHSMTDKSEIHKKVESHLGKDLSHEDYRAGMTTDHLNRPARIGRLIKDPQLRDEFARDPVREGSRSSQAQYTTSTVRGTEVAGQTNPVHNEQHPKGHSWANISCKNVESGVNRHYLDNEIRHGTVTHFVHDHNGQEIYRATLHPHHNDAGHVAYTVESEYGIKHPSFTENAHNVAKQLSDQTNTEGIFRKHKDVYQDNGEPFMLHPNVSSEQLHKYIKGPVPSGIGTSVLGGSPDESFMIKKLALKHPNSDRTHVQSILNNARETDLRGAIGSAIAKHPKATDEQLHHMIDTYPNLHRPIALNPNIKDGHIEKLMQSNASQVRSNLMVNPSVGLHHILKGTTDTSSNVRMDAYSNPNLPREHLIKGLEDPSHHVRAAVVANRKITEPHLSAALSDDHEVVRHAVFSNPNATSKHIEKAIHDPNWQVKMAAARHKSATSDQLDRFLEDKDPSVTHGVALNPNAKPEHLERAYAKGNTNARSVAVEHPNASTGLLKKALDDDDAGIRLDALRHPNTTKQHLQWVAKNSSDDHMRNEANRMLEARA